MKYNKQ